MAESPLAEAVALTTAQVGNQPDVWDVAGEIPIEIVRGLGAKGILCGEVPASFGGLGLTSMETGELTAHVGSLCSSLRSLMTSQSMGAWTISRLGGPDHRNMLLPRLIGGDLAAVAFSESVAGSDLSAIRTHIAQDGDHIVLNGAKTWITGAAYADLIVVFGRYGDGAAAVAVPADAPGVTIRRIPDALGCRAAGHADIEFDNVRLTARNMLPAAGQPPMLLFTSALAYGRISVAWGCTGILRACLASAVRQAASREQFGKRIADHQPVARHLAELVIGEEIVSRACEHASRCWDEGFPEMVIATMLAKHISAERAGHGSSTAIQVMASAGAHDGHVVARAYRDAKLMEIIEGTSEICQLTVAQHALVAWS